MRSENYLPWEGENTETIKQSVAFVRFMTLSKIDGGWGSVYSHTYPG